MVYVLDTPIQITPYGPPVVGQIEDIRWPVSAVALHGFLPPGVVAVAVPFEQRGLLREHVTATSQWIGPTTAHALVTPRPLPHGVIVLYPGDVVPVGMWPHGASVLAVRSPWIYASNDGPWVGPQAEPYVRTWGRVGWSLPDRIGYHPIASHVAISAIPSADAPGLTLTNGLGVYGATHARIVFRDNQPASEIEQIGAGESGSFEIWWLDVGGVWMHHEADDFDAAGRGVADPTHSAETYELRPGMVAIYIRQTVAGSFHYSVIAWNERAPR